MTGLWAIVWCLATVLAYHLLCAVAAGYEVSGLIIHDRAVFKRGMLTDQRETNRFQFHITVDGCVWRMRLTPEAPVVTYDYCEVAYDGEHLYFVRSIKSWVEDQVRAGREVGPNTAMAILSRRPVPSFATNPEVGPLWLTYASGCVVKQDGSSRLLSPMTLGVGRRGLIGILESYEQEVIVTGASTQSVPDRVVFLESTLTNMYAGQFTNSLFEVGAWTNVAGIRVPSVTSIQTYYPYREPGQSDVVLILQHNYRVVTEHVVPGQGLGHVAPYLPDLTAVSDSRFQYRNRHPIKVFHYFAQGRWYADSEVVQLDEYRRALALAKAETGVTPGRLTVLALLCILVIGPAVLLARGWRTARPSVGE